MGTINEFIKMRNVARRRWLIPIILVTLEADIRKSSIQGQPRQIVLEILSQKYLTKWTTQLGFFKLKDESDNSF
jgi:hypothetical protein